MSKQLLVNKRLTVHKMSTSADRILPSNSSDDQPSNVEISTTYHCDVLSWDSAVFRKYDSPVSGAEENHRIVMKPAPIMEEEEIEEVEEMEDQEQTKKKDLQQT
ncbi:hypothetical protein ALC57_01742 [Trachymyrmex cornetzi]|uniref:Uncharacterized protein n=1 Tax=Trachymyrmex cornetzi TaxID=471704 RepID=A0A195ELM3_9HYME|nr:hypothetical protein ALC57_01742 [Trachymyrmex cornetzi]